MHDIIQAALQERQQVVARLSALAIRTMEVASELALENTVHATHLLLLTKLDAVRLYLATPPAMLAWRIVTALDGALLREASIAFQEQFHGLSPA
jgi:hypothetical protein